MKSNKKILIENFVNENNEELELSFHTTNYEYGLIGVYNGNNINYFEFSDINDINKVIVALNELKRRFK